jgi:hypothetical protein
MSKYSASDTRGLIKFICKNSHYNYSSGNFEDLAVYYLAGLKPEEPRNRVSCCYLDFS